MTTEILLYSGGLDSLIAWYNIGKCEALYVDLGHRYAQKELEAIGKLPVPTTMLQSNYGEYFEEPSALIPGRNLYLGMYAAGKGADVIWLVAQKGEQNIPDRTPEFFENTSRILSFHFGRDIKFCNAFPTMYKHEMVKWYLDNGYPVEDLKNSVSCYSADSGHCGRCSSCFRKYVALAYNSIACEDWFTGDVKKWGYENYAHRLEQYDFGRVEAVKKVLGL